MDVDKCEKADKRSPVCNFQVLFWHTYIYIWISNIADNNNIIIYMAVMVLKTCKTFLYLILQTSSIHMHFQHTDKHM